jgi:hypothetical protein
MRRVILFALTILCFCQSQALADKYGRFIDEEFILRHHNNLFVEFSMDRSGTPDGRAVTFCFEKFEGKMVPTHCSSRPEIKKIVIRKGLLANGSTITLTSAGVEVELLKHHTGRVKIWNYKAPKGSSPIEFKLADAQGAPISNPSLVQEVNSRYDWGNRFHLFAAPQVIFSSQAQGRVLYFMLNEVPVFIRFDNGRGLFPFTPIYFPGHELMLSKAGERSLFFLKKATLNLNEHYNLLNHLFFVDMVPIDLVTGKSQLKEDLSTTITFPNREQILLQDANITVRQYYRETPFGPHAWFEFSSLKYILKIQHHHNSSNEVVDQKKLNYEFWSKDENWNVSLISRGVVEKNLDNSPVLIFDKIELRNPHLSLSFTFEGCEFQLSYFTNPEFRFLDNLIVRKNGDAVYTTLDFEKCSGIPWRSCITTGNVVVNNR